MHSTQDLHEIMACLAQGGVIAYPTESVYGLGCDPFNEAAVLKLLSLKQRSLQQGLILIISEFADLADLIALELDDPALEPVKASWQSKANATWVFPKSQLVPKLISGKYDTVAIRKTWHPVALSLCKTQPLVSTSANLAGRPAIQSVELLEQEFPVGIDLLVAGELGSSLSPSAIYDLRSLRQLR
jgi:L-threonylcarbamoyladenylate synthase